MHVAKNFKTKGELQVVFYQGIWVTFPWFASEMSLAHISFSLSLSLSLFVAVPTACRTCWARDWTYSTAAIWVTSDNDACLTCWVTRHLHPYDIFVQSRKYISSGQTHPCIAWRADYGLEFKGRPCFSLLLFHSAGLPLGWLLVFADGWWWKNGVTGLIYNQGERGPRNATCCVPSGLSLQLLNRCLRLTLVIGHVQWGWSHSHLGHVTLIDLVP